MPRKTRSSWGSNEPAGPGKRRIRYWADKHDGRGYRRCSETVRGSRRDADLVLAQRQVEHSSDAPVPTLKQAYEMWWLPEFRDAIARGDVKENTLYTYESRWRVHIEPTFGKMPVTDIRPLAMQDWLLKMTSSNAKQCVRMLRQILDTCVRYEVMPTNPARADFRLPRASSRQPDGVLTYEQRGSVLEELRGTCAYLPAVLCAVGSCRVGESLGPRVDLGEVRRVDRPGMVLAAIDIRRQSSVDGTVVEHLKNRHSVRTVIVPEPWSLDVLAATGPLLCDRGDGMAPYYFQLRDELEHACASLGIPRMPFKNLRNSWRTICRWELGMDEDYLEKMMGHAGRNVGEVHYDRPEEDVFADKVWEAYVRYRERR